MKADTTLPIRVSLDDLRRHIPFETLESAFSPTSLGIILVDGLPSHYADLRKRVLSYATHLANLTPERLSRLECPESHYLTGWSHGKEKLGKSGQYDTMKGSFYVNCAFEQNALEIPAGSHASDAAYPDLTVPNLWPAEDELPGFKSDLERLCRVIIDVGAVVASACDRYAKHHIGEDYPAGYLEHVVNTSQTTRARLLHYFPTPQTPELDLQKAKSHTSAASPASTTEEAEYKWCASHIDHGCLTGLTSALYIDENARSFTTFDPADPTTTIPLPSTTPPSADAGLYIHRRNGEDVHIAIPPDCLAFQTGEALELITKGRFKAVEHFVKGPTQTAGLPDDRKVSRNTLAVFIQPNIHEVVDLEAGTTFGDFTRGVMARFG